nr:hypothetical protein [Streptomyces sp. IBTA2]
MALARPQPRQRRPDRHPVRARPPPTVLLANDMRHLPADLRWTGFPPDLHI